MCVRVKWLSYPKLPSSNRVQPEICLFQGYIIKAQLQKIYLTTIGKSYKTYMLQKLNKLNKKPNNIRDMLQDMHETSF